MLIKAAPRSMDHFDDKFPAAIWDLLASNGALELARRVPVCEGVSALTNGMWVCCLLLNFNSRGSIETVRESQRSLKYHKPAASNKIIIK